MTNRPLVLLDVDGVINALSHKHYGSWDDYVTTTAHAQGRDWPITYSPTVVAWLDSLDEHAEVQWLTTWEDWAPSSLAPSVGLPSGCMWPVFGRQAEARYTGKFGDSANFWWKYELVKLEHADTDRRIVWLDDDLNYYYDARDWANARPNTLAVGTDANSGITQENMDAVDAFLAASS